MPSNTRVDIAFMGDVELIKKLEKLQVDVPETIKKALKSSLQIPANEMINFANEHYRSGDMSKSFIFEEPVIKKKGQGKQVIAEIGFEGVGGIHAIWMEHGGMHNEPYFFIKNARDNNIDRIKKAQDDALREVIRNVE